MLCPKTLFKIFLSNSICEIFESFIGLNTISDGYGYFVFCKFPKTEEVEKKLFVVELSSNKLTLSPSCDEQICKDLLMEDLKIVYFVT